MKKSLGIIAALSIIAIVVGIIAYIVYSSKQNDECCMDDAIEVD